MYETMVDSLLEARDRARKKGYLSFLALVLGLTVVCLLVGLGLLAFSHVSSASILDQAHRDFFRSYFNAYFGTVLGRIVIVTIPIVVLYGLFMLLVAALDRVTYKALSDPESSYQALLAWKDLDRRNELALGRRFIPIMLVAFSVMLTTWFTSPEYVLKVADWTTLCVTFGTILTAYFNIVSVARFQQIPARRLYSRPTILDCSLNSILAVILLYWAIPWLLDSGIPRLDSAWVRHEKESIQPVSKTASSHLRSIQQEMLDDFDVNLAWKESSVVTASALNVRQSPDLNSDPVGSLERGQPVEIQEKSGDWGRVSAAQVQGWVHLDYVKEGPAIMTKQMVRDLVFKAVVVAVLSLAGIPIMIYFFGLNLPLIAAVALLEVILSIGAEKLLTDVWPQVGDGKYANFTIAVAVAMFMAGLGIRAK